ncbi:unnamed protein product [Calicophoron daubneyi]|uniref:Uncharacterized protein n=1 Tax=Calicophoron daubneyi TaxID=300641 RepID=A0AAV2TFF1_CALDB
MYSPIVWAALIGTLMLLCAPETTGYSILQRRAAYTDMPWGRRSVALSEDSRPRRGAYVDLPWGKRSPSLYEDRFEPNYNDEFTANPLSGDYKRASYADLPWGR